MMPMRMVALIGDIPSVQCKDSNNELARNIYNNIDIKIR
jgi:hypothetical protein